MSELLFGIVGFLIGGFMGVVVMAMLCVRAVNDARRGNSPD